MNKRGQFFLIAAIIVVAIVSGLIGIANYASASDEQKAFYDLSEEVGFETKKVLDWGVFNELDDVKINSLTEGFLFDYSNYIGEEEVVFVYGNVVDGINVLYFEYTGIGSVTLESGKHNSGIQISRRTEKKADDIIFEGGKVRVVIDEIKYDFNLREGQNFFFIIIKDGGDERYVAKG